MGPFGVEAEGSVSRVGGRMRRLLARMLMLLISVLDVLRRRLKLLVMTLQLGRRLRR